jgi:uncharacterized protein (TIRG00374 family)
MSLYELLIMKKIIAKISVIVLTVVLVAILLSQINLIDITTTLTRIDSIYIVIGFILYLCTYFFRALRFYIILNNKVNLKDLFSIVSVHNMANNILPARTGEISYVYLSKKLHEIPVGEGVASLMVARVFDLITISLLFFISIIFIRDLPDLGIKIIGLIIGLLAFVLLLFLALFSFGARFVDIIRRVANGITVLRFSFVQYLLRKGDETVQSFKLMKSKKLFGYVFVTSIAVWCSQYSMLCILANAMGIALTLWCMIFALTFVFFTTILPIQTIGGFGIIESGWAFGFIIMGVSKNEAIASGFSIHIILLIFALVIGVLGFINIYIKAKK